MSTASDSSFHTWTSGTSSKPAQDQSKPKDQGESNRRTRLERAKAAIEVMERRLQANRKVRERLNSLDMKLDQVNRDMEAAYIKIKDLLTKAELGKSRRFGCSKHPNCSPYSCDYHSSRPSTSSWNNSVRERSHYNKSPGKAAAAPAGSTSIEKRLAEMEQSLKRLDNIEMSLASMPAVYSLKLDGEGIKDRGELETLGKLIDRFLVKLKVSKDAYENACGDSVNCIVCNLGTTSSISRPSLY
ncbi:unnamed protein product [Nippostrongylus brasiliensis]|uniref:BZIP domain-containing protein n=1 Tax=Nippostrongylus brasiliensis TaxID=27835 RepID=A0A0N4XU75_NIPBR|nr:unnamed protein product [Nippostrongylus brasiliensis]